MMVYFIRQIGIKFWDWADNTKEQVCVYERAENHKVKSGCLNHSNERIFQVNIQMQGRIREGFLERGFICLKVWGSL